MLKSFIVKCKKVDREFRNVPDDKIEKVFIVSEIKQEIETETNYGEPPPLVKINFPGPKVKKNEENDKNSEKTVDESDIEFDIQNETQNVIQLKKDPLKNSISYSRERAPCETCGKSYNFTEMKYHLNTHLGLFPFVCSASGCDKSFTNPSALRNHEIIHSDDRKFKCDECGATFKRSAALKHHKSYHGEPKIPCTVCSAMVRNL